MCLGVIYGLSPVSILQTQAADRRLNTEIPTCSLRTLYHTLPSLTSLSCIQGMDKKHLRRPCPASIRPAAPDVLPVRPPPCKVPCRGRFRLDNHAAVLRPQKTQPKYRRAYNTPYRNPCRAAAAQGKEGSGTGTDAHRRRETGQMFFIYTRSPLRRYFRYSDFYCCALSYLSCVMEINSSRPSSFMSLI